jgi:hypothetical protein
MRRVMKKNNRRSQAESVKAARPGLLDRFERWTEGRRELLFVLSMGVCVLMSVFLFDVKVSLSGDDSDYIVAADNFRRHFAFPGGHAPLYPMLLAPFVWAFGMNLMVFKLLSAVCLVFSFWLLYKSFYRVLPAAVLMPGLLLASLCSYIFFYAGYTYSEPLFMLFQGLFLYFFSRYFLVPQGDVSYGPGGGGWRKYLLVATFALCMALTRSIGYAVLGVAVLFLMLRRRWKDALYMSAAFVLVFALFQIFKSIAWPGTGEAYGISRLFSKDPYNPAMGLEDFPGMVKRFTENSDIYLSFYLYQFLGAIREMPGPEYIFVDSLRTVIIYLLYAFCMVMVWKRNRALLFVGMYAGIMNFASFIALQSLWGQDRLIMVYYPLMLLFLLGGIYYMFRFKVMRKWFAVYLLLLLAIGYGNVNTGLKKIRRNLPVLQQNLLGDRLYGLTPDWQNFIKASQWAAKNLDKDAVIVSRKPSISKVYTGRDFVVTPTALVAPLDSLIAFKNRKPADWSILVADAEDGVFRGDLFQYVGKRVEGNKFFFGGKEVIFFGVYLVPDEYLPEMLATMTGIGMAYTLDFDDIINQCRNIKSFRFHDPNMMQRYLEDNNIRYLLLPKLRAYTSRKTDSYINDVHNYRDYISIKRPDSFRTIHTIGTDEECEIVEFIR